MFYLIPFAIVYGWLHEFRTAWQHVIVAFTPTVSREVFIGFLTFSIPFMWNAYQEILALKAAIKGEKIENVLTHEYYQKILKLFFIYVQGGVVVFVTFGLLFVEIFPSWLNLLGLFLSLIYFGLLPQIYEWIQNKSETSLSDYLNYTNPATEDAKNVFRELWTMDEQTRQKIFGIKFTTLYPLFFNKLQTLLVAEQPEHIKQHLEIFHPSLKELNTFFITSREIFENLLKLHREIWVKQKKTINQDNLLERWGNYNMCEGLLEVMVFTSIFERALRGHDAFMFFHVFEAHVKTNHGNKEYVIHLMRRFFGSLFAKAGKASEMYDIWHHFFPSDWKITIAGLRNTQDPIPGIALEEFFHWAVSKISEGKDEYDSVLEDANLNLFSDTDPVMWARILTIVTMAHGGSPMESVINHPWNFGSIGRMRSYTGHGSESDKDIWKRMSEVWREQEEVEANYTVDLALLVFGRLFTRDNIAKFIEELKNFNANDDQRLEAKKRMLEEILNKINTKLQTVSEPVAA